MGKKLNPFEQQNIYGLKNTQQYKYRQRLSLETVFFNQFHVCHSGGFSLFRGRLHCHSAIPMLLYR